MKTALLYSAIFLAGLVALVNTEGRAYAMRVYGAPCGEVSGFAGLLQKVNFLPNGNCGVPVSGACSGSCTYRSPVSGANVPGYCAKVINVNSCTCLAGQRPLPPT